MEYTSGSPFRGVCGDCIIHSENILCCNHLWVVLRHFDVKTGVRGKCGQVEGDWEELLYILKWNGWLAIFGIHDQADTNQLATSQYCYVSFKIAMESIMQPTLGCFKDHLGFHQYHASNVVSTWKCGSVEEARWKANQSYLIQYGTIPHIFGNKTESWVKDARKFIHK